MSAPRPRTGLRLCAPAKLNLGLRVTGRRADGYHLLESLFAPLACPGALCDDVALSVGEGEGVALELRPSESGGPGDDGADRTAEVPGDETNLASRAAHAFLVRAGARVSVRIGLTKAIPAGAGLGGGSSDAGAVLRGLAELLPGRVGPEALFEIALSLGADVPFFLAPRAAWVRGIGERIGPEESLPGLPLALLHPGKSLATAAVYRQLAASGPALTEAGPLPTFRALRGSAGRLDREALARALHNDLEAPATALCPAVAELRSALEGAGAAGVGMTGSGPVVYGIFEEEHARDEALVQLERTLAMPPTRCWRARLAASA